MIAVIVPVHNEQDRLAHCLAGLTRAARHPDLQGEPVRVIVVLDACTDGSGRIARDAGVAVVEVAACNVGMARHAGAMLALDLGARWLAFSDADSCVDSRWLVDQLAQLAQGHQAVCGTIAVDDWSRHGRLADGLQRQFEQTYRDCDGHRHIHGANLGMTSSAYRLAGGFPPLPAHEDVALVRELERRGVSIAWSARPRVVTSSRLDARARGGFGDAVGDAARKLSGQGLV